MVAGAAQQKQATLINKISERYVEMSKPSEKKVHTSISPFLNTLKTHVWSLTSCRGTN